MIVVVVVAVVVVVVAARPRLELLVIYHAITSAGSASSLERETICYSCLVVLCITALYVCCMLCAVTLWNEKPIG